MGAHDLLRTLNGTLDPDAVTRHFKQWQEEDGYESGHGGYAGNWTTFNGITFKGRTSFKDEDTAREYILDYQEKRGPALAVRFEHTEVTLIKKPTFGGKEPPYFSNGRKCWVTEYTGTCNKVTPADQLTEAQKVRTIKLVEAAEAAAKAKAQAHGEFSLIVAKLKDEPEWWDARALKATRTAYFKAKAKHEKAEATLSEFNERMCRKLWKEKRESGKTMWLIGGWAAS